MSGRTGPELLKIIVLFSAIYQSYSFFICSLVLDMSNEMMFLSVAVKENKQLF